MRYCRMCYALLFKVSHLRIIYLLFNLLMKIKLAFNLHGRTSIGRLMEITVDGPSAWIVLFGGFLMQCLTIGYLKSMGILMREFQAYFRCSNLLVLLITSLTLSLINILSPVYSMLATRVPLRWMVLTSSLVICLSMCLLYTVFSLTLWVICLGLCIGSCLSACYSSVICKVNECFERRRDFASGICFAGSSTGAMLMPLLFTYIADQYSVAGCCLLIGGYFLHLVVVAVLMPTSINAQAPTEPPAQDKNKASEGNSFGSQMSYSGLDCPAPQLQQQQPGAKPLMQNKLKASVLERLTSLSSGQRWLVLIYMIATMLSNFGFTTQYVIFPMYLAEATIPNATTAILVAVNGLCDLVARVLIGWLSDRFRWRKSNMASFGMALLGIMSFLNAFGPSLLKSHDQRVALFTMYSILGGASGGVYMGIITSVLVYFVGISNLALIHSIVCCSWSMVVLPGQTLLGLLKDKTNTFMYSFAIVGLVLVTAAGVLMLERFVKRDNSDRAVVDDEDITSDKSTKDINLSKLNQSLILKNGTDHA